MLVNISITENPADFYVDATSAEGGIATRTTIVKTDYPGAGAGTFYDWLTGQLETATNAAIVATVAVLEADQS